MSEKWLDHVKLLETRIVLTDKQLAELLPTLPLEERIATVIGKYVGGAVSMHMNGENTCQQADARIAKYLLGKLRPWLSLSAPSTPASPPPIEQVARDLEQYQAVQAAFGEWLAGCGVRVDCEDAANCGFLAGVEWARSHSAGSLASSPQEQP